MHVTMALHRSEMRAYLLRVEHSEHRRPTASIASRHGAPSRQQMHLKFYRQEEEKKMSVDVERKKTRRDVSLIRQGVGVFSFST